MERFITPKQRAARLAADQFGAIAHDQAIGAGLTEQQIRTLLEGAWRREVRGVYVVTGSPDSADRRAMVAWLATRHGDGVLSSVTAAWFHDLLPPSLLPHVTVQPDASARCRAARIHRGRVAHIDRARKRGMTVTSVSRTLVDLAAVLERGRYEDVVDAALCRRLASAASVAAALARAGTRVRGAETVRSVLEAWEPVIRPGSVAEVRLLRLLGELGLDDLVTQHEVRGPDGEFIALLDLASPSHRRAFEYDGVEAHNPRRWARDEARYARLRAAGWEVESVTKLDLLPGEPRLRRIVERWLSAGAA